MVGRSLVVLCLLLVGRICGAQALSAAETTARAHFQRGAALYDEARYSEAIVEFEAARALFRASAFEFNIGRCYERLEQWTLAADAFERYLRLDPKAADAPEMNARIAALRDHAMDRSQSSERRPSSPVMRPSPPLVAPSVVTAPAASAATATAPAPRPLAPAAIGVGAVTLVLTGIGSGLLGSMNRAYADREALCRTRACTVDDLRARVYGGYSVLALAGVATVVDVALLVAWSRQRRIAGPR